MPAFQSSLRRETRSRKREATQNRSPTLRDSYRTRRTSTVEKEEEEEVEAEEAGEEEEEEEQGQTRPGRTDWGGQYLIGETQSTTTGR